jgi:acetylserotonin O-methyltransferase
MSLAAERPVKPASTPSPESVQQMFAMVMGFASTQIILAGDELGVFDALAERSSSAEELAQQLSLPNETLERLLNSACAYGLLRKHEAAYTLTEMARNHLVKSSPALRSEIYPLWAHLGKAVREGQPQWSRLPGMNPAGPFESMYKDEAGVRSFMDAMFAATYPSAMEFSQRYDFSRFNHIVDVGGASGAFFAAVLSKFTQLRGTIFDLPPVGLVARECMKRFNLSERVAFRAGDFFKDPLPEGGDMYVLGYILHDWDTESGTKLLRKIYDALPKGGAVFICETLYNADKDGPMYAGWSDMNMLVATTGKERSAAEYEGWLRQVGFARTEHQVCSGPKSYIVGYK